MMSPRRLLAIAAVAVFATCIGSLRGEVSSSTPRLMWRGIPADRLSGGLFAALDADGVFGPSPTTPSRTRAGAADLSKGHPPAVLDARVGVNVRPGNDPR